MFQAESFGIQWYNWDMPYGQVLELMVALILIESAPEPASFSAGFGFTLLAFFFTAIIWLAFCCWNSRRYANGKRALRPEVLEWLALIPLIINFYFFGLNALFLSFSDLLPSISQIMGLAVFLFYLSLSWACQQRSLGDSGVKFSPGIWIFRRLNLILPIVLPYVFLTVIADLLSRFPIAWIRSLFSGPYGSFWLLSLLLLFFFFFLPGLVRRLWRCRPLHDSYLRDVIEKGLERQGIKFSDILIWPAGEAMACTAAVIGIVPGFRYVLLTPCLIQYLTPSEIEAVIAHEAEHVRRKHILWYLFFLVAYSLVLFRLSDPLLSLLMSRPYTVQLLMKLDSYPASVTALAAAIPIGLITLLYFRFVLGFFMRNFERQADMAVFRVQGQPFDLISALKKVALLSGIDPARPNWHHFSIEERIEFLEAAFKDKNILLQHDKRLFVTRGIFLSIFLMLVFLPNVLPTKSWQKEAKINAALFLYEQFIKHKKKDPMWLVQAGGLFFENKMYHQAEEAYKAALKIDPENVDALNNLAWLYIKAEDKKFYHPRQALLLAMAAARERPASYILDTLAESFWANGYVKRAVETERLALQKAQANKKYYKKQLNKFLKTMKKGSAANNLY